MPFVFIAILGKYIPECVQSVYIFCKKKTQRYTVYNIIHQVF